MSDGTDVLPCRKLRIDSGDGAPVVEYRIEQDRVESRAIPSENGQSVAAEWQPLTAEQISSHVMADTVLAHWLRGRMGLYRLLRACGRDSVGQGDGAKNREDRMAA